MTFIRKLLSYFKPVKPAIQPVTKAISYPSEPGRKRRKHAD